MRGDRARGDRATAAVGPGVRGGRREFGGSGGRGGGVQAQPQQRDGRSGSDDGNQEVWIALGAIMPPLLHSIRELQTNVATIGDQHQRTLLNLIVSLESRVARLERQIRASEEDE